MERNSLGTLMMVVGLACSFHGSAQGAVDEQTPSGNQAVHSADEQETLRVRSLVLRPDAQGPVLELHYELRGAPAKEVRLDNTFVLEKSSGSKLYADQRPTTPGTLIIPDPRRLLRPGQRVTVVVAGIRQEQVLVQGLQGAQTALPKAAATPPLAAGATPPKSAPPVPQSLSVEQARVVSDGQLLDVRYRITGASTLATDTRETYVVDESTGERFHARGAARLGTPATEPGKKAPLSYLIFDTRGKIKVGQRLTVVISGIKREGVVVQE